MPQSLLKEGAEITESQWVVGMFVYQHHALIAIESYKDAEYALEIDDFLPGKLSTVDCGAIWTNEDDGVGKIRQRIRLLSEETTRREIFEYFKIKQANLVTWKRTAAQVAPMLIKIREDIDNPPNFCIAGKPRGTHTTSGVHADNCIGWTNVTLAAAEIQYNKSDSTRCVDNFILQKPDYHLRDAQNEDGYYSKFKCNLQ